LFASVDGAARAAQALKPIWPQTFHTYTVGQGVSIVSGG